jgi:hypothetical protein
LDSSYTGSKSQEKFTGKTYRKNLQEKLTGKTYRKNLQEKLTGKTYRKNLQERINLSYSGNTLDRLDTFYR